MARTKLSTQQFKNFNITNPLNGQVISFDEATGNWVNTTIEVEGGDGGTGSGLSSDGSLVCDIDSDNNQTDALFKITKHGGTEELLRLDENGNLIIAGTISEEGLESLESGILNKSQVWARMFACM